MLADVLHGEGGVLPELLVLLLGLAPGQNAVHRDRHQLDLNLFIWGCVVLEETKYFDSGCQNYEFEEQGFFPALNLKKQMLQQNLHQRNT